MEEKQTIKILVAGKSLEMTCLAGKLITEPRLENPTLLMVTDRQDLEGSIFDTFNDAGNLLAESPSKAESRKDLREQLNNKPSGGIIFTTILTSKSFFVSISKSMSC